jgi:hypothetical protein
MQMNEKQENMPIELLLVEDSAGDVRLMREVLLGVNDSIRLFVVSVGIPGDGDQRFLTIVIAIPG